MNSGTSLKDQAGLPSDTQSVLVLKHLAAYDRDYTKLQGATITQPVKLCIPQRQRGQHGAFTAGPAPQNPLAQRLAIQHPENWMLAFAAATAYAKPSMAYASDGTPLASIWSASAKPDAAWGRKLPAAGMKLEAQQHFDSTGGLSVPLVPHLSVAAVLSPPNLKPTDKTFNAISIVNDLHSAFFNPYEAEALASTDYSPMSLPNRPGSKHSTPVGSCEHSSLMTAQRSPLMTTPSTAAAMLGLVYAASSCSGSSKSSTGSSTGTSIKQHRSIRSVDKHALEHGLASGMTADLPDLPDALFSSPPPQAVAELMSLNDAENASEGSDDIRGDVTQNAVFPFGDSAAVPYHALALMHHLAGSGSMSSATLSDSLGANEKVGAGGSMCDDTSPHPDKAPLCQDGAGICKDAASGANTASHVGVEHLGAANVATRMGLAIASFEALPAICPMHPVRLQFEAAGAGM